MLIPNPRTNYIPKEIDTIEKLYLWCYYQLSSSKKRIEIEGEEEYVVDAEIVRPDGVDPRLFFITKINLPISENWQINKLKLWENAIEILSGTATIIADPLADIILWYKGDNYLDFVNKTTSLLTQYSKLSTTRKKYGTSSFNFDSQTPNYIAIDLKGQGNFLVNDWTIEFWINRYSTSNNNGFVSFSNVPNPTMNTNEPIFKNGEIRFTMSGSNRIVFTDSLANTWRHYAVTYNSVTKIAQLFIDGIFQNSFTYNITYTRSYLILGTYYSQAYTANACIDSLCITKKVKYLNNFNPNTDTGLAY